MGATYRADTVVVGGGLAGLVTAIELLEAGQSVVLLESGPRDRLGGLARRAFGGIFVVGTPEQRRGGIRDSPELALQDWLAYGELEETEEWPRRWAEVYVNESREVVYDWLRGCGLRFVPVVHWVERGLDGPGNSVPRFHMVWGTGQRLIDALLERIAAHPDKDRLLVLARHRVLELVERDGRVVGVSGEVLDDGEGSGGINVSRGEFSAEGDSVVVAAGGVCGDLEKVRQRWPAGYGQTPVELLNGSHPAADGTMHEAAVRRGASVTHLDRVWFYAAGVRHWRPRHEHHGLSLVPPRSALWVDWRGRRFDPPLVGGFDTSHLVETICAQDKQHSWQILNARIARRELAISGAEFNPAMRDRRTLRFVLTLLMGNKALVDEMLANCPDFVAADSVSELVEKMHVLDGGGDVDGAKLAEEIRRYDEEIRRPRRQHNDDQLRRIAQIRRYRGDRLRTCKFAPIDDARARPLIAIREQIITRKSLGGIQTDLQSRVLDTSGVPIAGLFAVGEAAGFGGGGVHGRRALEGTFLGGCVLTARVAARTINAGC